MSRALDEVGRVGGDVVVGEVLRQRHIRHLPVGLRVLNHEVATHVRHVSAIHLDSDMQARFDEERLWEERHKH